MQCFSFQASFCSRRLSLKTVLGSALLAVALALPAPGFGQTVQNTSLTTVAQETTGTPPAGQTVTPADVPPADPAPQTPAAEQPPATPDIAQINLTAIPTLVPMPKDPPEAQEVIIPAKSVVVISGESSWEDSIVSFRDAFAKLNQALTKAGLKPAGRPVAVFTKSSDDGFSYDAMIPVADMPAPDRPALADGIRYGTVPPGKALRFMHRDSYELISMTYEGVALYLETKNLTGKDELIEEYVTDITDQADKNTIVNIYVTLQDKAKETE
jgi:Transcriptional regulator, effector-binding domain/component